MFSCRSWGADCKPRIKKTLLSGSSGKVKVGKFQNQNIDYRCRPSYIFSINFKVEVKHFR